MENDNELFSTKVNTKCAYCQNVTVHKGPHQIPYFPNLIG